MMPEEKNQNKPKVLVGCPINAIKEYALDYFMEGLHSLTYPNFNVAFVDNSRTSAFLQKLKEKAREWEDKKGGTHKFTLLRSVYDEKARARICRGRNKARAMAIHGDYQYCLFLDSDVVPPADVIERLIARNKKIVSGVYMIGLPGYEQLRVTAYRYPSEEARKADIITSFGIMEMFPSRLIEADFIGLGCVLLHRDVFGKIEFSYDPEKTAGEDIHFSQKARDAGHKIYLDSSVLCKHYFRAWGSEARAKGVW